MKKKFIDKVIVFEDGSARFNNYVYTRKSYAYLVQARTFGTHTKEEWLELCAKYDFKCCNCKSEVIGTTPTKDHIIPTFLGGSDAIENLQPLCRECNTSKGRKTINYINHGN